MYYYKQTPILFCDDEGYEIIPLHKVGIVMDEVSKEETPEEEVTSDYNKLQIQDEVSIEDIKSTQTNESNVEGSDIEEEGPRNQVLYDASYDLDEFQRLP